MSDFDIIAVTKTIVRSAASTYPGLPAALANVWNEHEALETSRKVDRIIEAFGFAMKHDSKRFEKVEHSAEAMSEAVQLIARAVEATRWEVSELKTKALANVAANAIAAGANIAHDDKLTAIEALSTLTETDLNTFSKFASGATLRVSQMFNSNEGDRQQMYDTLGRLVASLGKLAARGLIAETWSQNTTTTIGDATTWYNRWLVRDFEIVPMGKTLVDLLKGPISGEQSAI